MVESAAKPAFVGHLPGLGAMPRGLRSWFYSNYLNFFILINVICHELLVGFKIKKTTSESSRKPIIIKYRYRFQYILFVINH